MDLKKLTRSIKEYALPVLVSSAFALGGGIQSCKYEQKREASIPLGFSEIRQIERDLVHTESIKGEQDGQSNGMAHTIYLAGLNDLTMKVFECWNDANSSGGDIYKEFAQQLKGRFDNDHKKHPYELQDLFDMVPQSIVAVKKQLHSFQKIDSSLPAIKQDLVNSWTEKHHDQYHTETYLDTESYTDSDGDTQTRIVTKTKSVYDHTDHEYWYHRHLGIRSSISLDKLLFDVGDFSVNEPIRTTSQLHEDGMKAAKESRKKLKDNVKISEEEYRKIASTWKDGSTLWNAEVESRHAWPGFVTKVNEWRQAKDTAKDKYWERTYSTHKPNPKEYEIAQATITSSDQLFNPVHRALDVLEYTASTLPKLNNDINQFITDAHSGKKGYQKEGKKVLESTRELYTRNFTRGFDIEGFRPERVVMWSTLGLFGGIALGLGAQAGVLKLLGKYKTDDDRELDKKFDS